MLCPNRCPNPAIHYIGGCLENITFENELPQYLQTSSLVGEHSDFSTHLSGPAQELLAGLLDIRAWKRFSSDQIETIKKHQFFSHVNWHVSRNRGHGRPHSKLLRGVTSAFATRRRSSTTTTTSSSLRSYPILRLRTVIVSRTISWMLWAFATKRCVLPASLSIWRWYKFPCHAPGILPDLRRRSVEIYGIQVRLSDAH